MDRDVQCLHQGRCVLDKNEKKLPRGVNPEAKRVPRDKNAKRIRDLEEEVEYLNDAVDFYHHVIVDLATRVSTLENIIIASGLVDFDHRKEEVLLN